MARLVSLTGGQDEEHFGNVHVAVEARGGAALSMRAVTGKPIKFAGLGEKMEQLEVFHPDRMAGRILGMGDVVTLVERAQDAVKEEQAEQMRDKIMSATFDFNDFITQMEMMQNMGGMGGLMKMMPGTSGMSDRESLEMVEQVRHMAATVGAGVIVIDHDLGFITGISDRIFALDRGAVIAVGTPEQIQADPRVQAAYLGTTAES